MGSTTPTTTNATHSGAIREGVQPSSSANGEKRSKRERENLRVGTKSERVDAKTRRPAAAAAAALEQTFTSFGSEIRPNRDDDDEFSSSAFFLIFATSTRGRHQKNCLPTLSLGFAVHHNRRDDRQRQRRQPYGDRRRTRRRRTKRRTRTRTRGRSFPRASFEKRKVVGAAAIERRRRRAINSKNVI